MKRFYKSATAAELGPGAHEVRLDGRPIRTPARKSLILPTAALAEASAEEWNSQDEKLDMAKMPMTALAYAALDRIEADPEHFIQETARFAETDLLCYRAPSPETLRARQAAAWDPVLEWLSDRYGARLLLAEGVMPIAQPAEAIEAVAAALSELNAFRLTVAHSAARIAGSAALALAMTDRFRNADAVADISSVDEAFQMEEWGQDAEAIALLDRKRAELKELQRFLDLT